MWSRFSCLSLYQDEIHPLRKFDGQQITCTIRSTKQNDIDCLAIIYYSATEKNLKRFSFEVWKYKILIFPDGDNAIEKNDHPFLLIENADP